MDKNRNITGTVIGVILVVIGILAFFGRFFVIPDMDTLWPLVIIVVGAAFFIPLLLGDKTHSGLAIPGSILITIGAILFVMNLTDSWAAWSYCWALIVCAVGAGTWINGAISSNPELAKKGLATLRTGLILFIIFGVVMEFIFSVSGESQWGGLLLWSVLLTLLGLFLLVTRLLRVRKRGGEKVDLFWPVLMVGVGLTALISYNGGLPGGALNRLLNLWPLLLVAAGVGLIFHNRSPWLGLIVGGAIVAAIFVVVFAGAQLGLPSNINWFGNIGPIQIGGGSHQSLVGSGHQITQTRPVSGVTRVELGTNANLEIRQGATESVTVTGDDNIVPELLTNASFGQMTIRYNPLYDIRTNTPVKVVLTVKDLNEFKLGSSGKVKIGPLNTGNFNLILSSSGNVNIQDIQANNITTHINSSSDTVIQGETNTLNVIVSSSGNFDAGDLKAQKAVVTMTSSGDVTLWVVNELRANISSSGNIAYYGNPAVYQNNTSSGRLISKGNK